MSKPTKSKAVKAKPFPKRFLDAQRKHLLKLRDSMEGRELKPEEADSGKDVCDVSQDVYDHELALELLGKNQHALAEIALALKRMDEGTYGVCEATGEQIMQARLEAIPWTRFSLMAQMEIEKSGRTRQYGLAGVMVKDDDAEEEPEE